jgi:hypothetical protein
VNSRLAWATKQDHVSNIQNKKLFENFVGKKITELLEKALRLIPVKYCIK